MLNPEERIVEKKEEKKGGAKVQEKTASVLEAKEAKA
jgi:hypothetical protein